MKTIKICIKNKTVMEVIKHCLWLTAWVGKRSFTVTTNVDFLESSYVISFLRKKSGTGKMWISKIYTNLVLNSGVAKKQTVNVNRKEIPHRGDFRRIERDVQERWVEKGEWTLGEEDALYLVTRETF